MERVTRIELEVSLEDENCEARARRFPYMQRKRLTASGRE